MVLSTKNTEKKHVFGDANLEKLRNKVVEKRNVSAVFVNIHRLSGLQYAELEALLGLPIYDR